MIIPESMKSGIASCVVTSSPDTIAMTIYSRSTINFGSRKLGIEEAIISVMPIGTPTKSSAMNPTVSKSITSYLLYFQNHRQAP